jgi:xylan 1,4-beta-xylosidase
LPPPRGNRGAITALAFALLVCRIVFVISSASAADAPVASPKDQQDDARQIHVDFISVLGPFNRGLSACVGSDRAIIHLRPEELRDLKRVHDDCGFRYVRCHGLLNEEMKLYSEAADGEPRFDWTNVDAVYDRLLGIGVRPFVELGFMPEALASGRKHIFWWNGNTTTPTSYEKWGRFVGALVSHLTQRYGAAEVRRWYFEVWNEPNLDIFWHGSQADYFHLYQSTASAIKAIDPAYRVGGPATAAAAWTAEFLRFCQQSGCAVDFVSTHVYGVREGFIDVDGKGQLVLDPDPHAIVNELPKVLRQIRASSAATLPLWITEWSSSYSSRDPVHDSYVSAAYILQKLREVPPGVEGMSYWAFSDQFEENGPPPSPFHGGFGLLNAQGLPKPSFFAYRFLNELGDTQLKCDDRSSLACRDEGGMQVLFWDYAVLMQDSPNQVFFARDLPAKAAQRVHVELTNLTPGDYHLGIYRVGYRHNDVYSAYLDLGSPRGTPSAPSLLPAEIELQLRQKCDGAAERIEHVHVDGQHPLALDVPMKQNDACLLKLWR